MEIVSSVFDPDQQKLDQRVYRGVTPRRSIVKFIEHKIYSAFEHQFGFDCRPYLDLYLTGSLTTVQYSPESDCDISIFVDYQNWPTGIKDTKIFRQGLIAFIVDKLDGIYLPGTQHPLQVFIVGQGIEPKDLFKPGLRSAWSFTYKTWFVDPDFSRHHDVRTELPGTYLRASAIGRKMETLIEIAPQQAIEMYKRLHRKRMLDQNRGRGDWSEGNVIYKFLAHEGLFDRLRSLGVRIASPWINDNGEPIGWDKEDDPAEYGYEEGEYEWTDEEIPDESDGFIGESNRGYSASLDGIYLNSFPELKDALRELVREMNQRGYFPACWKGGERGDYMPLDPEKELEEEDPPIPDGTAIQEQYSDDWWWTFGTVSKSFRSMHDYSWVYLIEDREGTLYEVPEDFIEIYNPETERRQLMDQQDEHWQDISKPYGPNGQYTILPTWTDPNGQLSWSEPPEIDPNQKKPRFSAIPCTTDFGEPDLIIETPWPGQAVKAPEPVRTSAEEVPYAYSEQLYGWKVLNVADDGTLISPSQGTLWPVGEPLRADTFNPSETVRGVEGIHTTEQEHWDELNAYYRNKDVSVLVKCALYGQTVRGTKGVYRSQGAMPVLVIGTNKEILLKVANKYHVDTELVSDEGTENVLFESNNNDTKGWKIIELITSPNYQGFQFDRRNESDESELLVEDPEGNIQGGINVDENTYTVNSIRNVISSDAQDVIREFFEEERKKGKDYIWSNSTEEGVNFEVEDEIVEHWDSPLTIDSLDGLIDAQELFLKDPDTFLQGEPVDGSGRYVRAKPHEDSGREDYYTDDYGLGYWDYITKFMLPREVIFSPQQWQKILYTTLDELASDQYEWMPKDIEDTARSLYYVPVFLQEVRNQAWFPIDLSTFFAGNLRSAYIYAKRLQPQQQPSQQPQLFNSEQYEQPPQTYQDDTMFFLNYLAQLAGEGLKFIPMQNYDYSTSPPMQMGWGTPMELWNEPKNIPKKPLVLPGGFSHVSQWKEHWDAPKDYPIQVLYDFNNDSILLGNNPTTASEDDHMHILGEYDGKNVILYHEHDHWVNATYFKKLWKHSFPNRPIRDVFLHNKEGDPELVPTKHYRKPLSRWEDATT